MRDKVCSIPIYLLNKELYCYFTSEILNVGNKTLSLTSECKTKLLRAVYYNLPSNLLTKFSQSKFIEMLARSRDRTSGRQTLVFDQFV